jgi:hypothetical protein
MANKSLKIFTVREPARLVAIEKVSAEMVQQMAVRIPVISPRCAIGIFEFLNGANVVKVIDFGELASFFLPNRFYKTSCKVPTTPNFDLVLSNLLYRQIPTILNTLKTFSRPTENSVYGLFCNPFIPSGRSIELWLAGS